MTLPQQPEELPHLATTENYSAGSEEWSGDPRRIAMSGAEQDAGITPEEQLGAQSYNWMHGLSLEHLAGIVDLAALNFFPPQALTGTFEPRRRAFAVQLQEQFGRAGAVMCVLDSTNVPWLSYDGTRFQSGNLGADLSAGNVVAIGGRQPGGFAAVDDGTTTVKYSGDGMGTWSTSGTALPSSGWEVIEYYEDAGVWVALGTNKIRTNPDITGGTWTSRTSPLTSTYQALCQAPPGAPNDPGLVLLMGDGSQTDIGILRSDLTTTSVNPDGVTAHVYQDAVWSVSLESWFVLTSDGLVFRNSEDAEDPDLWVQVTDIDGSGWKEICDFGRSIVVVGQSGEPVRNMVVSSDGGLSWRNLSTWPGLPTVASQDPWHVVRRFGGRLVL